MAAPPLALSVDQPEKSALRKLQSFIYSKLTHYLILNLSRSLLTFDTVSIYLIIKIYQDISNSTGVPPCLETNAKNITFATGMRS